MPHARERRQPTVMVGMYVGIHIFSNIFLQFIKGLSEQRGSCNRTSTINVLRVSIACDLKWRPKTQNPAALAASQGDFAGHIKS
jgi:hypothetical protein